MSEKAAKGARVVNISGTGDDKGRQGEVTTGGEFIAQVKYDGDEHPKAVLVHEIRKQD